MSTSRSRGFTLIELMIVVAVIAVLAVIALPSFLAQVRKSRRSDAIASMNTIALSEEQWRSNCPLYADLGEPATTNCPSQGTTTFMSAPASSYYTITVPTHTATQYVVQAVASGNQAKDSQFGTSCSTLTVCANITATAPCTTDLKSPPACFGK